MMLPRVGFLWYCCRTSRMRLGPRLLTTPSYIISHTNFYFLFGFTLFLCCLCLNTVEADCWYDNDRYDESAEVPTPEPCLNCTCKHGALLCYLRICPKLPNPPPNGCILLHRYRSCCPELICTGASNSIESRSDDRDIDLDLSPFQDETLTMDNACILNGSVYGPGSAMDSSSMCEYCFCLGGRESCVKPKCLLTIKDCEPVYDTTDCCPIRYNCTSSSSILTLGSNSTTTTSTSTSTTSLPSTQTGVGDCWVNGTYHQEGVKVVGVGHSVCDNCYCIKSLLRCEPLSCAPPLSGCIPVIKTGECCATSYNCSGSIEIQPEPNYGQYPIMSKEYAKLRKEETQRKHQLHSPGITIAPFYVVPETSRTLFTTKQRSFGTTRQFLVASPAFNTTSTMQPSSQTSIIIEEQSKSNITNILLTATTDALKSSKLETASTNNDDLFGLLDFLFEDEQNETKANSTNTTTTEISKEEVTLTPVHAVLPINTSEKDDNEIISTTEYSSNQSVTITVLKSTDCFDSIIETNNNDIDYTTISSTLSDPMNSEMYYDLADGSSTTEIITTLETTSTNMEDDEITTFDGVSVETEMQDIVTFTNASNVRSDIIDDMVLIINDSKSKNEELYDYDYNVPSLPPSLPNLKIIPFVAADALDSQKDTPKDASTYNKRNKVPSSSSDRGYSSYGNMFSPPVETQGGFVPKDPSILEDNFFKTTIRSPAIDNNDKPIGNCFNGIPILHGQSVRSDSPCTTCTCFYGNIVCQKVTCPIITAGAGCSLSTTVQDPTLCCPLYICDETNPKTLDRRVDDSPIVHSVSKLVAGNNVIPDAVKDVIKTEPPPNLQSLISDMIPLLNKKNTTTSDVLTETTTIIGIKTNATTTSTTSDSIWQILFSGVSQPKTEGEIQPFSNNNVDFNMESKVQSTPSVDSATSSAAASSSSYTTIINDVTSESRTGAALMINLAGCNIYGRMYRVGRIITELSGPCLECKCTEVGVHCTPLNC